MTKLGTARQLLAELEAVLVDAKLPLERLRMAETRIDEAIFNLEMALARASTPRPGEDT